MKLSVLALDYDGTVAHADALDPAVRAAIAAARTRGIVVILVTGRILDELRRVARTITRRRTRPTRRSIRPASPSACSPR